MRQIRALFFVVLLFCGGLSAGATDFNLWDKAMPITFSGYNPPGGGTLTNFPVLVTLRTNLAGFSYTDFASPTNGADLRFSASNQTDELNFEIEKWDTNGASYVWVQVPTLSGTNTKIWAYWGNPLAPVAPSQTNGMTWSTDFRGVWHMQETNVVDATTNGNIGVGKNGIITTNTGLAGNALSLVANSSSTSSNYVDFGTGLAMGTGHATLSIWFKTATNALQAGIIGKSVYASAERYSLSGAKSPNIINAVFQSTNPPALTAMTNTAWASGYYDNQWHQLTATFNRSGNMTLYVDGAQKSATNISPASSANLNNPTRFLIGAYGNATGTGPQTDYYFPGSLDEGRLMRVPASSNWVWAAWMNAASNGAFNAYGAAESQGLTVRVSGATGVGATTATLNGTVANNAGDPATEAFFCWDYTNKGTATTADWAHVEYAGNSFTNGQTFLTAINGLLSGSTYVYRCYATNSTGSAWSGDATNFRTLYVPSVTLNSAEILNLTTVLFQGAVTETGGETPNVWFLYWLDGDTLTNAVDVGAVTGACSAQVTGLMTASNYGCRVMASNSAGIAYSGTTGFQMAWPKDFGSIPITLSGYNRSEVLTNFPVLIALSTNLEGFSYSAFSSPANGADLRFTASNQLDAINFEIEKWDTNGTSYVWVQVPLLAGTNTRVWALWGNPSAGVPACQTNGATWSNGYVAVWHLGESTPTNRDSTINRNDGTNFGNTTVTSFGRIGSAKSFDGAGDGVDCGTPASLDVALPRTISAWIKPAVLNAKAGVVGKDSQRDGTGYSYLMCITNGALMAYDNVTWRVSSNASIAIGNWYHVVYETRGDGRIQYYVNGQSAGTSIWNHTDTAAHNIYIGSWYKMATTFDFNGVIDEVNLSSVARGSNWVWASWANQVTNSTFTAYGSAQNVLGLQSLPATAIGVTNATLNGILLNDPVSLNTEIAFCWGPADAGQGATSDWPNVVSLGSGWSQGDSFSNTLASLLSGSTYVYRCYATNAGVVVGPVWSAAQSFTTVYRPSVTNLGPVNGYATTWLRGQVTDTGLETPSVWFYWWANGSATTNIVPMGQPVGAFSNAVTGLAPYTNYQYSILASNLAGGTWSSVSNFQTLITFAVVTNGGAQPLTPSIEFLQGGVTNTGGDTPQVWFLYWIAGGATTNAYGVGAQTGACSATVSGLLPGSNYVFMLMASNLAGAAYSGTAAFQTTSETIYFVATNGNNSWDGLTWGTAVSNVEVGVQRASLCTGTVVVGDGSFAITSFWVQIASAITVRSLNGPNSTTLRAVGTSSTYRRVMLVSNANAFVSGFTMTDGNLGNNNGEGGGPGGLRLVAGTVSNCVIHGNFGSDNSGGIDMKGGLLTHCTVSSNQAIRANNPGYGTGGGITLSGGTVQFCVISNNYARKTGSGIRQTGGTVRDSLIVRNYHVYSDISTGVGVHQSGGTLERCEIRSNAGAWFAGGLYLDGNGLARNCLFANNTALYDGGGVYMTTGRLINATLAGNRADINGPGLYMTAGWVSNSVVYGNGSTRYVNLASNVFKSGGTFAYGCATPLVAGTDNVAVDPLFVNAAAGDYRLSVGSPCIDTGANLADVTNDLLRAARPQDGNGDGSSVTDRGAYEAGPLSGGPFTCSFDVAPEEGYLSVNATFTAFVGGPNTNITWYGWDFENDGIIDDAGADKRVTTHTFGVGYYDVSLTVSNSDSAATSVVRLACVRVAPSTNYVWKSGSHTAPFDTWAKAARDIQSAVDVAWSSDSTPATVLVTNGVYTNTSQIAITRPLIVRSVNGPTVTTVNLGNVDGRRAFQVANSNAWLEGFTATGGKIGNNSDGGAGILLDRGTVTNCIATGCSSIRCGAGIWVKSGLLVKCRIFGNTTLAQNSEAPGLYLTGGTARDCDSVSNNVPGNNVIGGGVYMTGGTLERCRVSWNTAGNVSRAGGTGGGIFMTGGTAVDSYIIGNTQYGNGGGVYMTGGTLRNCLVVSNTSPANNGGGIYMAGSAAQVENCTVADNSALLNGNGLYQASGGVTNTVIFFNTAVPNVYQTGGSIGFSSMDPVVTGAGNTNNLSADPFFVDGYRLGPGSLCIDGGTNLPWSETGKDLAGSNRVVNDIVDMGAFEKPAAGAGDPLGCNFDAVPVSGSLTLTPTFTALLSGGNTNTEWFRWDYGDGVTEQSATLGTTSHTYGPGWYTVTLTVRNTDSAETSAVRTAYIKVAPATNYVAKGASNVPPYLTWATAASNVEDAVDAAPLTVLVSNGTFNSTRTVMVERDMTIRSLNGPAATVINAGNVSFRRVFQVSATNAWIEGFTLYGGSYGSYSDGGAGVLLENGTVTNCWITSCVNYQNGAGAWVKNGLLVGCRVYGNNSGANQGESVGVYLTGGTVRDCVIVSNGFTSSGHMLGAGVYQTSGYLERCRVEGNMGGNVGNTNSAGGGIYLEGGLATDCIIAKNTTYGNGGGVYLVGGVLRNSLVLTNRAALHNAGGLYVGAGRAENCTVVSNTALGVGNGLYLAGGGVTNTIVYFNGAINVHRIGGSIAYSCMTPLVTGAENTDADPQFKAAALGDYHLAGDSPCINAGTNLSWSASGTDLDGLKRMYSGRVDMGVFESLPTAGTIFTIR